MHMFNVIIAYTIIFQSYNNNNNNNNNNNQGRPYTACSDSEFLLLKFMNLFGHLVGILGWGISPTQGLYLYTGQYNTEKPGHTSMPRVGFEPTIPVFERSKTIRALDSAAIGTANFGIVGSNPSRGVGVFMRFSVLCCPVQEETLR
jgi:hypothetical protein